MTTLWHLSNDGGPMCGPVTSLELKRLAVSGLLKPTDSVQNEAMQKPLVASFIKGLFVRRKGTPDVRLYLQ